MRKKISLSQSQLSRILVSFFCFILLAGLIYNYIPKEYYVDWIHAFRPATLALFSGESPYSNHGVYNPPWTFLLLLPLALIPPQIGAILLSFLNLFSLAFIAYRLGAKFWIIAAFLLTPQISLKIFSNPNIDFLAAFGFLLPPQIGLFFLAIKPQIGIAVAIYWLVESWRKGGYKEIIRVFAPVGIAFLLSWAIFGPYFTQADFLIKDETIWYRYPLFPYTIPVGLALLVQAIQKRQMHLSIAASPFLSPYVASYTYPIGLLGLVHKASWFFPAYAGFWIIYLIHRLHLWGF